MALSFWQILLVVVLFLLLFGRGKIPQLMSDVATGIKSFKKGMQEDEAPSQDKAKSEETASLSAAMKQDKTE
ncbi:twin-arginine translocase TatA/TatE family subunit [Alkalimonas sp. MEB108]|uniref:Sec-independent protein translocase protein TatA n=1 Tax=Alkalimonas cellulosilytica TaxID=3058395 RepID=A0ABU7J4Y4_9GAMM|nr:twin-arginine translocase TatA/TatE family subunit [Alkalimonas sp. MEB108]MEE2001335.1 twin-arginine translocase TatA/TatE family subunit [Alkalimonas sp. MEB108]